MSESSDQAAGLAASMGTGMYSPRRARRSQPWAAHRESFFAAVSASTPSSPTTSAGVTNRRPEPRRAASSARPDGLIPAGNDMLRPPIHTTRQLLEGGYQTTGIQ